MLLSNHVQIVNVMNAKVAGTTNVNGDAYVDTQGYDGVLFIAHIGTLTATQVTKLEAQGSTDHSTWNPFTTDAVTPAMADADSNKCLVLDIFRPMTRYVRPTVERGTANAVIDSCIAILYQADRKPVTDAAVDVSQSAQFVSP